MVSAPAFRDLTSVSGISSVKQLDLLQQAQGPKTPRPIRSERTEWVRTWYALGTLVYGLGYLWGHTHEIRS